MVLKGFNWVSNTKIRSNGLIGFTMQKYKVQTPHPQSEGNFLYFRYIHFRRFRATLVFVPEDPPTHPKVREKKFSLHIYPFRAILSNFGFCGRKLWFSKRHGTQLTPFKTISPNFIIVYPIDSFQDHMIKLGQVILKWINWVHNYKIRSYGLERSQLGTQW